MFFYNQTPRQMLVDLINEANPDLPFPINTTDYDFMEPVAITALESGHNTEIRIIARPSAPYLGNVVLTYRRLHLSSLFQGVTPVVKKWVENAGSSSSTTIRATLYDLLPLYSKRYGLTLDESQINDQNLPERLGNNPNLRFNMIARSDSLIYTGSVSSQWIIGRRELDDLLQIDEIGGIRYPGGNDFTDMPSRKMYLTPVTFEHDFTLDEMANQADWNRYNNYALGGTTSAAYRLWFDAIFTPFADFFESETGIRPTYSNQVGYRNTDFDFGGFYMRRISLPNANYPEANHEYFNRCMVLECPSDCSWATGYIYIHYNV